jgi:maltose O-acetyltransferase
VNLIIHLVNMSTSVLPVREIIGFRRWLANLGGIAVGRKSRITHGVKLYDRYITIGESVWIGMNTVIASTHLGKIRIEDNVDIAPCCRIMSGTHLIGGSDRRAGEGSGMDISIGKGSWIGSASTILAGAQIGSGSIVAAGSVVIKGEYPPNVLLAGVPAKVKRELPK